jgi:hypothetical protein
VDETCVSRLTTISTFLDRDVPGRTWLAAACVLATVLTGSASPTAPLDMATRMNGSGD